jgi:D-alanyl-lipoteichoic acid acyltransferase DltB (MBOAT superfamily)
MTLSSWLRDYLFFPVLARLGARGGYVAVWLTMFAVGMWHGASWNFVIYANMHAGAMVFNRWNRRRKRDGPLGPRLLLWPLGLALGGAAAVGIGHSVLALPWPEALYFAAFILVVFLFVSWLGEREGKLYSALHVVMTFHYVALSRIFFRSPDLDTARDFVSGLVAFDGHWIRPGLTSVWVWLALAIGLLYHFTPRPWVEVHLRGLYNRIPGVVLGLLFAALAYFLMWLLEGLPRAFIYFQF